MSQPPSGDAPDRSGDRRPGDPPSYPYPPGPWQAPEEATRPIPSEPSNPSNPSGTASGSPESPAHGTGGYPPPPGYPPGQPGYPSGQQGYPAPPPSPPPGYPGGYSGGYTGGYTGAGTSPEQQSVRTQAVVSLVLNVLSLLAMANVFGIAGGILAGVALGRVDTDLGSARNLVRWSWIVLVGGLALLLLAVLAVVAFLFIGGFAAMSGGFSAR